jgi:Domain of unknown function (DUF1330)
MKTKYAIALSMLAGMTAGAAAVQSLHAQANAQSNVQAKPAVYMIALNEVTDADRYGKEYVPPAQASVKAHGGVYVAAGPGTALEGDLPKGPVDFAAIYDIGKKYAKFNIVAVNGVSP